MDFFLSNYPELLTGPGDHLFSLGCSGKIEGRLGGDRSCSQTLPVEAIEENLCSLVFMIPLVILDVDAP